jgi:signal transduction histidine kinase
VAARLRADDTGERAAPLVRLVALYMTIFGIALLTFAYFALTRLIVRPLEALGAATARVATGARTVRMPRAGSLEIAEVSEGVQRMTESLIADEEALRAKVEELTTATERLEHAQAQLVRSERMASVGRLAAGVAHEIGNPIAALLGLEDLLLDGGIDEPTQNDFLGRMKKETLRISGVVRDLLDFARPESATGAPDAEASASADVAEVAADVAALVKPQKEFKGGRATLEVDVPARASVRLSSSRLTQVLLNLVLNAGHAARSRVTVRARPGGNDTIRVEVEDDGPGIPPELVDRVFEPFVTTKQVGEGTGLGLAVCRGLVESAGGTIAVDTRYRDGARLVVTLPRA